MTSSHTRSSLLTVVSAIMGFIACFSLCTVFLAMPTHAQTVEFEDFFTESSDTQLSSHTPDTGTGWTRIVAVGGSHELEVESNGDYLERGSCGSNDGVLYQADATLTGADYEVSVEQRFAETGNDFNILAARVQDANNMYALLWNSENDPDDDPGIYKRDGGSWTYLENIDNQSVSNGDVVTLKVEGSVVSVRIDGTEVAAYNDPSPISGTGFAGIGMGAVVNSGDDCDDQEVDNFTVTVTGSSCTAPENPDPTTSPGWTCNVDDTARIVWDWTPSVSGHTGYEIQVDDDTDFSSPFVDTTVSDSTTDYETDNLVAPDSYYARVRATYSGACTESDWSETATVAATCTPLVASFEYCRPDPSGSPDTVQFFDTSADGLTPYTWNWDFGDGTPNSSDQHPSHTFGGGSLATQAQYTFEDGPGGSQPWAGTCDGSDALVCDDFDTVSDSELSAHTPDIGTSWSLLDSLGGATLLVIDDNGDTVLSNDQSPTDSCEGAQGALYQMDDLMPVADYEVSVLQVDGDSNNNANILAARIQDMNNMYAFKWNEENDNDHGWDPGLFKRSGGTWTRVVENDNERIDNGSTVTLRVEGSVVSVLVDGIELLSYDDPSPISSAGRAGLGSGAVTNTTDECDTQVLDEFRVTYTGGDIINVCYAIAENNRWYESVNPDTGDTTVLGQIGDPGHDFQAIATDPTTNMQYTAESDDFAILDPGTGNLTWLPQELGTGGGAAGNINFSQVQGLSFDSATGILWALEVESDVGYLFQIDHTTGAHIPDVFGAGIDYVEITAPSGDQPLTDIAVDPTDGQMYAVGDRTGDNDPIYLVNKTTGAATFVATTGLGDLKGLGFGANGQLYGSTAEDSDPSSEAESMWAIDKSTGASTLVTPFAVGNDHEALDCLTYGTVVGGGNATVTDVSANSNDGTLVNMQSNDWVTGVSGLGLQFDGSNDYVTVPHSSDFDFNSGKIAFDFRLDDTSATNQMLFSKDAIGNNSGDLVIIYNTNYAYGPAYSDAITVRLQDGSSSTVISSDQATTFTQGQWYTLELWFGGLTGLTMTIDSVQQTETDADTTGWGSNTNDILMAASNASNPTTAVEDYAAVTLDNLVISENTSSSGGPYTVELTTTDATPGVDTSSQVVDPANAPTCGFALTSAAASSCVTMSLVWDNPDGTDSYEIFRSDAGGPFTSVATVDAQDTSACGPLGCTYDDTPLSQETQYDYYVEATQFNSNTLTNTNGNQGDETPSCTPSGVTATPAACDQIDVAWTAPPVVTVEAYTVYRGFDSGGPFTPIASGDPATYCPSGCDTLSPADTTSYSDTSVFVGVGYYYNVTATVEGEESPASSPAEFGQTECFRSPIFIES